MTAFLVAIISCNCCATPYSSATWASPGLTPYQQEQLDRANYLAQQQQIERAAQRAAQAAAIKQAEWEKFRDEQIGKLANQRDLDYAKIDIKYNAAKTAAINGSVMLTNYVAPGPNFRMVDGTVYNITNSSLWVDPAYDHSPAINPLDNPLNVFKYSLVVETIEVGKITCGVYRNTYRREAYTGQLGLADNLLLKHVVITHFPNPDQLVSGQPITCLCMRVANYIENGVSLEAYDYGIQATEDVMEVIPSSVQRLVQIQNEIDAEKEIVRAEYQAKIDDLPNVYAKYLNDLADAKKQAIVDKVLQANKELAARGDTIGLLRMGEYYRDGFRDSDGFHKDPNIARDYFSKAAAKGSPTAADNLKEMDQEHAEASAK